METIKKYGSVELIKYENGKYGVIDHETGDDSGPRYRSIEMANDSFEQLVKEAKL